MNPIFHILVLTRKLLVTACLTILVFCSQVYKSNASTPPSVNAHHAQQVPSINAVLRTQLAGSVQYEEYWVSLSSIGLFVTNGEFELIKNFNAQSTWLVDLGRNIKHRIDLSEYSKNNQDRADYLVASPAQSNIMGVAPCVGWKKVYAGTKVWRGKMIRVWHCFEDPNIKVNTQYFDEQIGLIVRVEHPHSRIDELINITPQVFDEQLFLPKANLVETSLLEFSSRVPSLRQFANKE